MGHAQLVSFWDGPVSWVERLCAASMVQHGHPLTIFTYDPDALAQYDFSAQIRDAREVVPETDFAQRYRAAGRYAMFSNLFRLHLQRQQKGIWVDLDCYMVKPLMPESDYVFGLQSEKKLNGAVLGLPPDSPMTNAYLAAITADPMHTPWAPIMRRLRREGEILLGRSQPDVSAKTKIGPGALTYFARKHGVLDHALPKDAFYAIPPNAAGLLADPADPVSDRLNSDTVIVHVWNTKLRKLGLLEKTPPPSSYLGKACEQYDIRV